MTVAIVGNKKTLVEGLRRRFPGLHLTFIDESRSEMSFPANTRLVVLSRWSGHRWSVAARRAFGGDRVRFCRGGTAQIAALIDEMVTGSRYLAP